MPAPPADSPPAELVGGVEAAVQAELDALPAATDRPGLTAVALALARLMDNPLALPQLPAAAGRLVEVLDKLAKRSRARGRLAAVKSMTDEAR